MKGFRQPQVVVSGPQFSAVCVCTRQHEGLGLSTQLVGWGRAGWLSEAGVSDVACSCSANGQTCSEHTVHLQPACQCPDLLRAFSPPPVCRGQLAPVYGTVQTHWKQVTALQGQPCWWVRPPRQHGLRPAAGLALAPHNMVLQGQLWRQIPPGPPMGHSLAGSACASLCFATHLPHICLAGAGLGAGQVSHLPVLSHLSRPLTCHAWVLQRHPWPEVRHGSLAPHPDVPVTCHTHVLCRDSRGGTSCLLLGMGRRSQSGNLHLPAAMLSHSATCSVGAAVAGGQDFPLAWVVAGEGATGVAAAAAAAITTTVGTAGGTATWRAMIAATGETVSQAGLWPTLCLEWCPGAASGRRQTTRAAASPALLQDDALPLKCAGPYCDALHTVVLGG